MSALNAPSGIFPLVTFRVVFGALMLFSTLRFWHYGWIEDFYISPSHFFSYFGQDWILPYSAEFIYGLFVIMALSALGILLGAFYRASAFLFFISFTYVELIDKTTYLNHYYLVSIIAFLMILVPAHRAFSVDSKLFPKISSLVVPRWGILALQFQIAIVYVFAGLAKLNYDWLFTAQPMSLWLESKTNLPLIGGLFEFEATAFIFSWAGALFDLGIVFLLFSKKLRPLGYMSVVIFHLLTWWLFPIGVFPWVMMGITLIFFSSEWHETIWNRIKRSLRILIPTSSFAYHNSTVLKNKGRNYSNPKLQTTNSILLFILGTHFIIQLLVPMRHLTYEGDLYWKESGYRFSWRVMLMEKTGYLEFIAKDITSQKESIIELGNYFTAFQQRQLVTQPDMILQAAHIVRNDLELKGLDVEIYAKSFSSLNGERHAPFVDPNVNLADIGINAKRDWVLDHEK